MARVNEEAIAEATDVEVASILVYMVNEVSRRGLFTKAYDHQARFSANHASKKAAARAAEKLVEGVIK